MAYLKILEVIEKSQRDLEGENYVTLSLVPMHLHLILQSLECSIDDPSYLDYFKFILKEEFELRLGFVFKEVNYALMASLLDPRTVKMLPLWNLPPDLINDCYLKIASDCQIFHPTFPLSIFLALLDTIKPILIESNENDPLHFWKNHQHHSLLYQGVQSLLCIPASSAPSERVFSAAGLLVSKLKARTDDDRAEKLIFLKIWLKRVAPKVPAAFQNFASDLCKELLEKGALEANNQAPQDE